MSTISPRIRKRILALYDRGWDWERIARIVGVPRGTVSAVKANNTRGPEARTGAAQKAWRSRPAVRSKKKLRLRKDTLTVLTGAHEIGTAYDALVQQLQAG